MLGAVVETQKDTPCSYLTIPVERGRPVGESILIYQKCHRRRGDQMLRGQCDISGTDRTKWSEVDGPWSRCRPFFLYIFIQYICLFGYRLPYSSQETLGRTYQHTVTCLGRKHATSISLPSAINMSICTRTHFECINTLPVLKMPLAFPLHIGALMLEFPSASFGVVHRQLLSLNK